MQEPSRTFGNGRAGKSHRKTGLHPIGRAGLFSLEIIYREPESLVSLFQQKFEQVFGYFPSHAEFELHSLRIRIASPAVTEQEETFASNGQVIEGSGADGMDRSKIRPGQIYKGPLLVADASAPYGLPRAGRSVQDHGESAVGKKPRMPRDAE